MLLIKFQNNYIIIIIIIFHLILFTTLHLDSPKFDLNYIILSKTS